MFTQILLEILQGAVLLGGGFLSITFFILAYRIATKDEYTIHLLKQLRKRAKEEKEFYKFFQKK